MGFRTDMEGLMKFGSCLYRELCKTNCPIFLCVGSDKFIIDSLAPIVAEKLKLEYNVPAIVYGGLSYNINRSNIMEAVNYIETMHSNSSIILIDASLGDNIGEIELKKGVFAGLGRCIPNRKIGNISILGIVGRKVADFNLNSTRLRYIVDMADFIAKGCYLAINKWYRKLNENK